MGMASRRHLALVLAVVLMVTMISTQVVAEDPEKIDAEVGSQRSASDKESKTADSAEDKSEDAQADLQVPQRAHTPETEREAAEPNSASKGESVASAASIGASESSKESSSKTGMSQEQLETASQELKSLLAASSASLAEKSQENKRLTEQIAAQEATIANLQAQIDAKSREDTAQAAAKANALADLQKQLDDKSAEVQQKLNMISDLEKQAAGLNDDLSTCRTQRSERENELESVKQEKANHLEEVKALQTSQQELQDQVSARDREIVDLRKSVDEKTEQHKKLKKEQQDLRKQHLHLHDQHRILEAKYADPAVQHFLTAKAVAVYRDPGIAGAANKTLVYVLPTLKDKYSVVKSMLNDSEATVYKKLNAFVGTHEVDPWLPVISGCLVYGTVLVPFTCTVCLLTRIVCKLRPLLLFCHLDLLFTSLCAGIFAVYSGTEPLAAFAHHDPAVYLFTQAVFALIFCLYAMLLVVAYCLSARGTSEGCYRLVQILGVIPALCIYYSHVWTPAMMDEMPHIDNLVSLLIGQGSAVSGYSWLPYVPISVNFLVLLELERMCWATRSGKESDNMSIVVRDELELGSIIPNVREDSVSSSKKE
jgi:hypothetical protein|mmetsp:Transcript_95082/g.150355  ORF Transcript_95082/g.150355 Transcript_95082/m.150355 type:complete len:597 (-) Transcript_95082:115-1905(-)